MNKDKLITSLQHWTRQYGRSLCPSNGFADTFGDGMRAAKKQIGEILAAYLKSEREKYLAKQKLFIIK